MPISEYFLFDISYNDKGHTTIPKDVKYIVILPNIGITEPSGTKINCKIKIDARILVLRSPFK